MEKAALIFLIALGCAGCSNSGSSTQATPTPSPEEFSFRATKSEEEFLNLNTQRAELVVDARAAVSDFVRSNLPGWTVKGLSSQLAEGRSRVVFIDADLEKQGHRIVISFEARKFFPESGEGYWLAVPVNKFRLGRLQALTEADLQKQLKDAQTQLEEAPNSSDEP